MARQALTDTPIDLISALGLTAGTTYAVQAELFGTISGDGGTYSKTGPFIHLDDSATIPAQADRSTIGIKLRHLETILASGDKIWAWTTSGKAVINVYAGV